MVTTSVFLLVLWAVLFDHCAAETAESCMQTAEDSLQVLLNRGASVSEKMCDIHQEMARCAYMSEDRRPTAEETRKFMQQTEDALRKNGETGRVCETDWDAITRHGNAGDGEDDLLYIKDCDSKYDAKIQALARGNEGLSENTFCEFANEYFQCCMAALPKRPGSVLVGLLKARLKRFEDSLQFSCKADVKKMVDEYWDKKESGEGEENGASELTMLGAGQRCHLIWLGLASMVINGLMQKRLC